VKAPGKTKLIFREALEKETEAQRQAYLDEACGNDPALRTEIDALLKGHFRSDGPPDGPLPDSDVSMENISISETPGTVIDRYKLLEKIGEGGMAVVYMAEQTEPIRRKVALKIIKLGMDTKSVIARFEAERQALAMMNHPNIAKVLDAGTTETGRPYFVMELVKGASITDFCDANNLSTRERLELFVRVCRAVQHAHQKGIIHRDIKPSNVMVTLHDGLPVPKVIDFGVAKAINHQLTEKTLFTRYAQVIGTPTYMSPEQAQMSGLDIDIRTDIYSLGTLLYELLTGGPPFDSEYLLTKSYSEMQRVIREEEPARPSTRLSTLGEVLVDVARLRRSSPDALRKAIRGDLDWIAMKTLEKDRNRRYDSVSEFAADIRRYLKNEPVLAGPPSALYRMKKFVQRHRVSVTATTAVAAAVIIGLAVSTSLYRRMRQAHDTISQLENKVEVYTKLSTIQMLYSQGRNQAALDEIESMFKGQNLEPETQLLRARLLIETGQPQNAEASLLPLTKAEPQIAGAAHYLLARINIGVDAAKVKEHEALAASLLPETAEAYAVRAITASNTDQALQWLDRAIELDPAHYPSRKSRVLIYFTRGQDQNMAEDAAVLIALRPAEPLGYAIRAIVRRQSGRFADAVADHVRALELCESDAERIEVYDQRYETYTSMGDNASALEDARRVAELEPESFQHRLRILTSSLALKDFAAVQREYRSIVRTSHQWDRGARRYLAYQVFDMLDAGQTFEFPPEIANRAPFAEILRVAECYHTVTGKAVHLALPRQGAVPYAWSPDGKQLLCGWAGIYGALQQTIRGAVPTVTDTMGLKIIDVETGKEHHVTTSHYGVPAWSPDGKYIAYPDSDKNLFIVPADAGQPKKLTAGNWPQWSNDSQHLYYNADRDLCSVNINDPDATPQKLTRAPNSFVMCETQGWLALAESTGISMTDFSSGSRLYECPSPWPQNWRLSLSPDGRELFFKNSYSYIDVGPLILEIRDKRLYRVLDYPVDSIARSPDGSRLAIGAKRDIWIMDMDPNLTTSQALGRLIPDNDLITDEIERISKAITADPTYPENYLRRAVACISIDEFDKAESDLNQFDALVTADDHHVGYEMFWWLRQCCRRLLEPHADRLMEHFPADVPSYQDLIPEIVERMQHRDNAGFADKWAAMLQKPEDNGI